MLQRRSIAFLLALVMAFGMPLSAVADRPDQAAQSTAGTYEGSFAPHLDELKVETLRNPLGIDNETPEFSWLMHSPVVGVKQLSYRIEVAADAAFSDLAWDSGVVLSDASVGILYGSTGQSKPLEAQTHYHWRVTVSDNTGAGYSGAAQFSTGMMDPTLAAWDGAEFIGHTELSLDAASTMLFHIQSRFKIDAGDSVSFVFGAGDYRFNDPYQNVFNSPGGENFIRLELDLSDIPGTGGTVNLYRVGYHEDDGPNANAEPYKTANLKDSTEPAVRSVFSAGKNSEYEIDIMVDQSTTTSDPIAVSIDGVELSGLTFDVKGGLTIHETNMNVSPYYAFDQEGNVSYLITGNPSYPHLNQIGFQLGDGDQVTFTDYRLLNVGASAPEPLFGAETGAGYDIFEDFDGVAINKAAGTITLTGDASNDNAPQYADPSYGSQTYLRAEFEADGGLERATLYATAMGAYEVYLGGKRVGEDWFNPGMTQFRDTLTYHTYDVTGLVSGGSNVLTAMLGQGFYTGYMTYDSANYNLFGDHEGLMLKLVLEYADGTARTIVTDSAATLASHGYEWKAFRDGPVRYANNFQGERYDAGKEAKLTGWDEPGFAYTRDWIGAEKIEPKPGVDFDLVARRDNPVQERERLRAQKVLGTHSEDGRTWTYDLGVNMVGVPSITIPEGWLSEGDEVIIRYAEVIYPGNEDTPSPTHYPGDRDHPEPYAYADLYGADGGYRKGAAGKILTENYRAAMSTDFYIASAEDEARPVLIEPHFTFHGFRYVQITLPSATQALPLENVEGIVLSSSELLTGEYQAVTSDGETGRLINQFFQNTQRSQLGNFVSLPTDCPQRDERMGWTGDLNVYSRTATYHGDAQGFLRQWMVAVRDDQSTTGAVGNTVPRFSLEKDTSDDASPTWGGAVVMVPWQLYQQYGDLQVVEENFDAVYRYLAHKREFPSQFYPGLSLQTSFLADHIGLDGASASAGNRMLNNAILIYFYNVASIMAEAIGDSRAEELHAWYEEGAEDFNKAFVDPDTGYTMNRNLTTGELEPIDVTDRYGVRSDYREAPILDAQSTYSVPLFYGIFSDEMTIRSGPNQGMSYKAFASKRLAELVQDPGQSGDGDGTLVYGIYYSLDLPYTVTSGFAGTPTILPALSLGGQAETAYRLMASTDYASWLYQVKLGATSQWELWNAYEQAFKWGGHSSMNSQNHYALGGSAQWLYEYSLGITSDGEQGYQNFVLQPMAGYNVTSLQGSYTSNYGKIESAWTADGNGDAETGAVNQMLSYSTVVPANTGATLYLPMDAAAVATYPIGEELIPGVTYTGTATRNGAQTIVLELGAGGFDFAVEGGKLVASLQPGYVVADLDGGSEAWGVSIEEIIIAAQEEYEFTVYMGDKAVYAEMTSNDTAVAALSHDYATRDSKVTVTGGDAGDTTIDIVWYQAGAGLDVDAFRASLDAADAAAAESDMQQAAATVEADSALSDPSDIAGEESGEAGPEDGGEDKADPDAPTGSEADEAAQSELVQNPDGGISYHYTTASTTELDGLATTGDELADAESRAQVAGTTTQETAKAIVLDDLEELGRVSIAVKVLREDEIERFAVRFVDGTVEYASVAVNKGMQIGNDRWPADPEKDGYTFLGWYTQPSGGGALFDRAGVIESDLTLYARWRLNSSGSTGGQSSSRGGNGGSNLRSQADAASTWTASLATAAAEVTRAAALEAVSNAVTAARGSGTSTAVVRFRNPGRISRETLQAMVAQAGDMPLVIHADSMNGSAVDVRLMVDPAQAAGDINLAASTVSASAAQCKALFANWFANDLMVVCLEQEGGFGQPVMLAAKPTAALAGSEDLVIYAYNSATNSYHKLADQTHRIDANGYLHFQVDTGGTYVISDGTLRKSV